MQLISEHRRASDVTTTRLHRLVPSVTKFFTELDLVRAYRVYNEQTRMSSRLFVSPTFNEVRHILNVAQVHATCSGELRLISFDGDQTLYADGSCISNGSIIGSIIRLMQLGITIAVVTAASYGDNAAGYEGRLALLLEQFRKRQLDEDTLKRFFVVGGECNYLFQCNKFARMQHIRRASWQPGK